MASNKWIYYLPIIFGFIFDTTNSEDVTITTPLGNIKGQKHQVQDGQEMMNTFMGIPYAKPPVGNLRFAKPVPYVAWEGTLDATTDKDICVQILSPEQTQLYPMSEDCLFLNIYVPNNISTINKRSVMVWIHGGGYQYGSGKMYDGSSLASHGDVIVVTINYRLGIFGFFTLGNSEAGGNYGLWDQMLALKWVKSNIHAFGGNPDSITIFGESAGGFSVSLLSVIPSNKGLFHRVIAQSGVASSQIATTKSGAQDTFNVGSMVSCNLDSRGKNQFIECMRGKDSSTLLKAYASYMSSGNESIATGIMFAPVVDSNLFMESPKNIISGPPSDALNFFKSLDMIIGNCDSEGSVILEELENLQSRFHFNISDGIPSNVLENFALSLFVKNFFSGNQRIQKAICDKYCVHNDVKEQARQIINMYGDLFFVAPSMYNLHFHAMNNTKANTYQYIYARKFLLPYEKTILPWFTGSGHASELDDLFNLTFPGVHVTLPSEEYHLANDMKTYWTNFAKYGNPNGGRNMAAWPAFDSRNKYFLRLNLATRAEMDYINDRMSFWLKDIPNIHHSDTESHSVDLSLLASSILGR